MIGPAFREAVLRELEKLGAADQQRVMDFVRALGATPPKGTPGAALSRFSGVLDKESVDEMLAAIEDGCERIDEDVGHA
jgi:hypothetical protein